MTSPPHIYIVTHCVCVYLASMSSVGVRYLIISALHALHVHITASDSTSASSSSTSKSLCIVHLYIIIAIFCTIDFHEDLDNNTFGKFLKGNVYWAASDFRFDLMAKVIWRKHWRNARSLLANVM